MKLRNLIILLLFLSGSKNVASQHNRTIVSKDDSSPHARKIINSILDIVGVKANFEVLPAKIPNAAAVTYAGKRFIVYNPLFMEKIDRAAGKNWASIGILAHEIGHHLIGHTLGKSPDQHFYELQADEFSGFVLKKMGASLEDAQIAIRIAGSEFASPTHPARSDRLHSIAKGWNKAIMQITTDKKEMAGNKVPSQVQESSIAFPRERLIAFDVHFATEPDSKYFITTHNKFVRFQGDKFLILGKLTETGTSNFPLVLFNGNHQVFLVNPKGEIYTARGNKIGWMNPRT